MNDVDEGPAPGPGMVPVRSIVQIAVAAGDPNYLYALANDGTLWRLAVRMNYVWFRLPALPSTDDVVPATVPSVAI